MGDTMPTIADRIKDRRLAMNMSQYDLADASGIKQAQISRYERGTNDPTGAVLIALARALQVSVDWLLGMVDHDDLVTVELSDTEKNLIDAWRRGDTSAAMRIFADRVGENSINKMIGTAKPLQDK